LLPGVESIMGFARAAGFAVAWRCLRFLVFKFSILMVGTVKRVKLRHHAEFCGDRLHCCGNTTIFRFLQDGDRPPSSVCDAHVWTTHESHLVVFITVQNLVGINAVVSIICKF